MTVPQQTLDEAVNCTPDVHPGSGKKPVVLVGGVGFDPADAWGWGTRAHWPATATACAR